MLKMIAQLLYFSSAVLGSTSVLMPHVLANEKKTIADTQTLYLEKIEDYAADTTIKETSVSQLRDIHPNDWTYRILQSFLKRYGVADNNLNHHRSLTRYEFAAQLNTAIKLIEQRISNGSQVSQEDLMTLGRFQQEFATELAIWHGRIANLETRISQVKARQFSTTTKLSGEVIFALGGAFGGAKADDEDDEIENNIIFGDRVRLNLTTSFTGEDRLFLRMQAGNIPDFAEATGTPMGNLGFEGDNNNKLELVRLEYSFPLSKKAEVYLASAGGEFEYFTDFISPFSSSSKGAISRFGRYNPIYRQGFGAALGLKYQFSEALALSVGYVADDADDPEVGIGSSPYGAIAQLTLKPIDEIELGLTYLRSYNKISTGTGSELANDPFNDEADSITANSYGLTSNFRISPSFSLGGWVGLTQATARDLEGNPKASIFNYAVTLAFPDLGIENSLGGIVIGQPPKVTSNDLGSEFEDNDTSLHLEAFYRLQVTDAITITPGFLMITNPEHNNNNDTIYIGTVRTTFSF
jgi:hypothetical protein